MVVWGVELFGGVAIVRGGAVLWGVAAVRRIAVVRSVAAIRRIAVVRSVAAIRRIAVVRGVGSGSLVCSGGRPGVAAWSRRQRGGRALGLALGLVLGLALAGRLDRGGGGLGRGGLYLVSRLSWRPP